MSLLATRDSKWFLTRSPWQRESFSLALMGSATHSSFSKSMDHIIPSFFFPEKRPEFNGPDPLRTNVSEGVSSFFHWRHYIFIKIHSCPSFIFLFHSYFLEELNEMKLSEIKKLWMEKLRNLQYFEELTTREVRYTLVIRTQKTSWNIWSHWNSFEITWILPSKLKLYVCKWHGR